ncbi:hypothetical protein ACIA8O_06655 [Kitasatospora sp. NPDC051853]|uniref:hypothetical protein n=1 Tax=Kitasatospora sp. NPDC051853 TaxID=3364058 RepID=UPI00379F3C14
MTADQAGGRLVLVDAGPAAARAAHRLGCHTVFVQLPGSAPQELVDDRSGYYSVDFLGEGFPAFVEEVLRPLAPTGVVSPSARGRAPAALANALLGIDGSPAELARRAAAPAGEDPEAGALSALLPGEPGPSTVPEGGEGR